MSALTDAAVAVEQAAKAEEDAAQRAQDLSTRADELREAVRSGERVKPREIADAEVEAEHAALVAESTERRHKQAREEHRQLQIVAVRQQQADPENRQIVADAARDIAVAVASMVNALEAYNARQSACTSRLVELGHYANNGMVRAPVIDPSVQLAKAILTGVGNDTRRLGHWSLHTELPAAIRQAAAQ